MIYALTHEELQYHLALAQLNGWSEVSYDIREEMQRRVAKREREITEMS